MKGHSRERPPWRLLASRARTPERETDGPCGPCRHNRPAPSPDQVGAGLGWPPALKVGTATAGHSAGGRALRAASRQHRVRCSRCRQAPRPADVGFTRYRPRLSLPRDQTPHERAPSTGRDNAQDNTGAKYGDKRVSYPTSQNGWKLRGGFSAPQKKRAARRTGRPQKHCLPRPSARPQ